MKISCLTINLEILAIEAQLSKTPDFSLIVTFLYEVGTSLRVRFFWLVETWEWKSTMSELYAFIPWMPKNATIGSGKYWFSMSKYYTPNTSEGIGREVEYHSRKNPDTFWHSRIWQILSPVRSRYFRKYVSRTSGELASCSHPFFPSPMNKGYGG